MRNDELIVINIGKENKLLINLFQGFNQVNIHFTQSVSSQDTNKTETVPENNTKWFVFEYFLTQCWLKITFQFHWNETNT